MEERLDCWADVVSDCVLNDWSLQQWLRTHDDDEGQDGSENPGDIIPCVDDDEGPTSKSWQAADPAIAQAVRR